MASATILTPDTIAALDEGAALVTGGNRLARGFQHAYNRVMAEKGETVWETPAIRSFGSWIRTLWLDELSFHQDAGRGAALLSREQEDAVWERIIRDWCEATGRALMQIPAAAESARAAYGLLHDWDLPMPRRDGHHGEDVDAFIDWVERFDVWCNENGWLSDSRLSDLVAEAFKNGTLQAPPAVFVAGLEDETPAQRALLKAIEGAGAEIRRLEPPSREADVRVVACRTSGDEITTCARWLRRRLEADPEQTIGVVVPDLGGHRPDIERIFEDILSQQSALPGTKPQEHVNFSLGPPFSEYPLVAAALNALDLLRGESDLPRLGALLRSPFLGDGETEAQERALLDAELRKQGDRRVRLPWLIELAGRGAEGKIHHCPKLESRLRKVASDVVDDLPSRAGPIRWVNIFEEALAVLGWPGERTLNSPEHQVREKWDGLLDTFAGLETMVPPMTLAGALARLRRLAAGTTFQPESPAAPVQVMGFLEATGAQFDALWVMGLTDTRLPESPHLNPLLPVELQREHDLPHSSPDRERKFARRRLQGLVNAAPEVVLSYPETEDDSENAPSPLLADYAGEKLEEAHHTFAQAILDSAKIELLDEDHAPALETPHRSRGGTGVLKAQAACPFQAFGTYRLHARKLEEPQDGLGPRGHGNLVHVALEKFWDELRDQEALLALSEAALKELIERVTGEAIADEKVKRPSLFTPVFTAIQKKTLEQLLHRWVEQETMRSPFRVVGTEKELLNQRIGPLVIERLVVDRIDEVAGGRCIVIDYKTGGRGASRNAWKGTRPDDPQLPLYATLAEGDASAEPALSAAEGLSTGVAGVLFARVRPDEPRWAGLTRDDDIGEGSDFGAYPSGHGKTAWEELYPDWKALLAGWQRDLESLADAYVAGGARVDPKNVNTTCRTCHLAAACRITELMERSGGGIITPEDQEVGSDE